MHFNHLIEERRRLLICKHDGNCHWLPTGNIRATAGRHVHVSLLCKMCSCREEVFLSEDQFETQKKILYKEVKNEL